MRTFLTALLLLALILGAQADDRAWSDEVLSLVSIADRDALTSALDDAGSNAPELARAVTELQGDQREAALWLIQRMPHLDRLEMTADVLVEHVTVSFETRGELPDSLFLPYVLTYRIDREPVEAWRAALRDRWSEAGSPSTLAAAVNRDVASSAEKRDRGFFGPLQAPLFTLSAGSGTETEIAVLTTAALRAVGVPSRRVRVPALGAAEGSASWIEFHDGTGWMPLYPLEPDAMGDTEHIERDAPTNVTIVEASAGFETRLVTERYTETAGLELSFVSEGRPAGDFEHFSVSVLNGGALVPLDALEAVADDEGRFEALLGDGRYVVAAGVRDAQGDPFVKMLEVELSPGEVCRVALDVSPSRSSRGDTTPLSALVATDPTSEPDRRMLPLITSALAVRGAQVTYVALGGPGAAALLLEYVGTGARVVSPDDLPDGSAFADGLASEHETPVIELYDARTNRAILRHEGYDLNIGRVIESARPHEERDEERE